MNFINYKLLPIFNKTDNDNDNNVKYNLNKNIKYNLNDNNKYVQYNKYIPIKTSLPIIYSLRNKIPYIFNQGELGSSIANAIAAVIVSINNDNLPSRLFINYNYFNLNIDKKENNNENIKHCLLSVSTNIPCHESIWPYNIKKHKVKPSAHTYNKPLNIQNFKYFSVYNNLLDIKSAIYENNLVLCGINVYKGYFEITQKGIIPLPSKDESPIGGHVFVICGYNDIKKCFTCLNSVGINYRNSGFFYLPYEYITNDNITDPILYIIKYESDKLQIKDYKIIDNSIMSLEQFKITSYVLLTLCYFFFIGYFTSYKQRFFFIMFCLCLIGFFISLGIFLEAEKKRYIFPFPEAVFNLKQFLISTYVLVSLMFISLIIVKIYNVNLFKSVFWLSFFLWFILSLILIIETFGNFYGNTSIVKNPSFKK